MRNIVKIGDAFVVRGMSNNEYAHLVGIFNEVTDYDLLNEALILLCEHNYGYDPLWDFPLDELQERDKEDYDYFFVELQDDEGNNRYFETLIPITQIKEVL